MRTRIKKLAAPLAMVGIGAAALTLGVTAQAESPFDAVKPRRAATHDQNGQQPPVVFSADDVVYDDTLGLVTARGNVEINQNGRTVLADVVTYNQRTDTVTASGHVSLIQESGDTVFANYVELTDQMRDGFIKDVRLLMADRSRLAGNTARRTDGKRLELRRGVYSPCDLCRDDPDKPPLWQLRAEKIVHDQDLKLVEYYDVTLDLDGLPVFYSPYLSHPDPSVKRRSGFLPPTYGSSSTLGYNITVPYYWALGSDRDVTFAPILTTRQNLVLAGEYRQRFANGELTTRGSIVDANQGDSTVSTGNQIRGHIFSSGQWDIDDDLRAGFDVQRATDQTYLRAYRFGGSENFLRSRGFLEDFDGRDYGVINTYSFQSLRNGVSDRNQPIILPQVDYTWAGKPNAYGGRFTTTVDALDLVRQTGSNSRRVSTGTQYDQPFAGPLGQQFNLVAGLRGDGYNVSGLTGVNSGTWSGNTTRAFPQIGLEWRDPWVRRGKESTIVIEPRAAIYAAPPGLNQSKIPNDDSQSFDFSDADLFNRNRFYGYDRVDSGQRVDYGLAAAWYSSGTANAHALIGQSYRFQHASPFTDGTGLYRQQSDYVGRTVFSPSPMLDLTYRFRFDERNLRPQRQEVSVATGPRDTRFSVSLLQLANNPTTGETHRIQLSSQFDHQLTPYWTVSLHGTRDLVGDSHLLSAGIGAQYSDECLTFSTSLSQDGTRDRDIKPGTVLLFQFVFKNLGQIGVPSIHVSNGTSS